MAVAVGLDSYRVESGSALEWLVELALAERDGGLVAAARAAGWTWEAMDSGSLVECAGLAARGRDGGLMAELVAGEWDWAAEGVPELVEVAGRVLAAAREADVAEVDTEVRGLLRASTTAEDRAAARDALAALYLDLDDLRTTTQEHRAQVEAVVTDLRQRDERDRAEAAVEAARARAVASLESSRRVVQLTTAAHHATMTNPAP